MEHDHTRSTQVKTIIEFLSTILAVSYHLYQTSNKVVHY